VKNTDKKRTITKKENINSIQKKTSNIWTPL
jgi:hypothetical protein